MRSRLARMLGACVLSALSLSYVRAFAQSTQAAPVESNEIKVKRSASIKLKAIVEEALMQNPEIKAMKRSFDMMRARIPQTKALPEPMLNIGYMGNPVPLPPFDVQKGDPSSGRVLSFTQALPFPGKLSLKSRVANVTLKPTSQMVNLNRINADQGWRLIVIATMSNLVFKTLMVAALGQRQLLYRVSASFGSALAVGLVSLFI